MKIEIRAHKKIKPFELINRALRPSGCKSLLIITKLNKNHGKKLSTVYNTTQKNATPLFTAVSEDQDVTDPGYWKATLYVSPEKHYFTHGEGGSMTAFAQMGKGEESNSIVFW